VPEGEVALPVAVLALAARSLGVPPPTTVGPGLEMGAAKVAPAATLAGETTKVAALVTGEAARTEVVVATTVVSVTGTCARLAGAADTVVVSTETVVAVSGTGDLETPIGPAAGGLIVLAELSVEVEVEVEEMVWLPEESVACPEAGDELGVGAFAEAVDGATGVAAVVL
jgi:hypothetical protein